MYNIYIYIGFYFLKYILRFRSTRSRRPRRSRQGRNPRFGGSGNCLGKCFRKCLGSCLGSWGTMDFSISLTLFWSGNREDFALYWHTSCPQMHLAANLSNNIQHIFPFPPQKETIWDCCDGGRFSRQLSLCCVQAPKKSSQSFRSEPYPKVIQAGGILRQFDPVHVAQDLISEGKTERPDGNLMVRNLLLRTCRCFLQNTLGRGGHKSRSPPHPQQGSPVYWREEGMQSPWSQPWRLAWHRCKTHGECSGAFSRNGLSYRHLG